jgi:hypothetical protein
VLLAGCVGNNFRRFFPFRLRLASAGIDVETAETSGQFELRNWSDAYLSDGHFDQHRMLAHETRLNHVLTR